MTTRAVLVETDIDLGASGEFYNLTTAARLAGIHPERLRYYCRIGLLSGITDAEESRPRFNDHSVYEIRRIEFLRREHGVNLSGIRIILDLMRRNEVLTETLRFHRGF